MKLVKQQILTGERSLFHSKDLQVSYSTFADGESPLKESQNIKIDHSIFKWKYPLWYCKNIVVEDSILSEMARSGIWYTENIAIRNTIIEAPKTFRRAKGIKLENVTMPNADETLWNCDEISLKNVMAKGDYFGMNSTNIKIDGFELVGNYSFDGGKNIEIHNAKMLSKDVFWNCENVTVYDSFISGEYLGWNSKNLTFVNCTIESLQYDFEALTDRHNTNSLKWDVDENVLPMWVADMDFKTAPEIIESIQEKVSKGILGYTIVPDAWYRAISNWWGRRHHFQIDKEWLIFCTGVVPAVSSAVRKMTSVGENVLVQTPVYNIFFNSIVNNGRNIVENKLLYDGKEYSIDFEDLENKLSNPQTTMMILCNPHNPIGKVWDKEALERIGELCFKHHVLVLSDEIHCDLTDTQHEYIPFASVSEICAKNSITCIAPTKAFNIAGVQTAAIVVLDEVLRHKMNKALNTDEVAEPNAIAMEATVAAFTKGEAWLNELRFYLEENRKFVNEFIEGELQELYLVPAHATYLLWIDCRRITQDTTCLCQFLHSETGLYLSTGESYGETGRGFIRINAACPRERLKDGLTRLKKGIEIYQKACGNGRL